MIGDIVALCDDGVLVKLHQQGALGHLVAGFCVDGIVLALQVDGVQTHVDQDLRAEVGDQAHSVTGFEHHIDSCVTGGIHLALGGTDGDALTQDLLAEGGVVDFLDGNSLTLQRGGNLVGLLAKQLF